jgi:hypothetical protein
MRRNNALKLQTGAWLACIGAAMVPFQGWACAACFGQSDSPLAAGMNWGIFSLLGFIIMVLGGIAGFGVFLARRSAAQAEARTPLEEAEFIEQALR